MNYADVLNRRYLGKAWSIVGNTYTGINWQDASPKPTKSKLESLWPDVEYEMRVEQAELERRAAYQAETDGLFFAANASNQSLSAWRSAREAIKNRYPDPPR
jgi:hypothetical protein